MAKRNKPRGDTSSTLLKLASKLFEDATERAHFIDTLQSPPNYVPSIVWTCPPPDSLPFPTAGRFAWQPDFVDRVEFEHRPGQHQLHDEGAYYCLDGSSVFTSSVLLTVKTPCPIVIDVCASPGGKSILAWRMLSPEVLISNEVIGKRLGALTGNLRRCGLNCGWISHRDPRWLAEIAQAMADVVIVDAPCSGQSLIAKGKPAPGCFHPSTINLCANRQRRILANAASLVAGGGYLAYITCTFAEKENEKTVGWFLKNFPQFAAEPIAHLEPFQSTRTDTPCYRLWPFSQDSGQLVGAGGFVALLRLQVDHPPQRACDASVLQRLGARAVAAETT